MGTMDFQERHDKDVSDGLKIFVTLALFVIGYFIWDATGEFGHMIFVAVLAVVALVYYLSRARTTYGSREDDTQERSIDQH